MKSLDLSLSNFTVKETRKQSEIVVEATYGLYPC